MANPVSRTISIYFDQAAAEQSAEKLRKTIERLEQQITKGTAAGKDMSKQLADLDAAKAALNQVTGILDGKMAPSMRQLTAQATKLRNELANMSRDAPGYDAKLKSFQAINGSLEIMQQELRGVSNAMTPMDKFQGGILQGLGIGSGIALFQKAVSWIKDFAGGAADAASNMEQLRVSYKTLLGSKEAADAFIKQLQSFAASTPFEFNQVADLSKQLLAFGFSAKEIIPTLDMLGNIASGVGKEKLPNLILAYSQVRGAGKLMAQDLNQLINAGFNPLQVISEKTGKSVSSLRDDMRDGLITFDKVQDAFKSVTSEGGRFFNLMQNQSATTSGTLSNLKDNWEQWMTSLGKGTNGVLKNLYLVLGDVINKFKEWTEDSPTKEIEDEKNGLNNLVFALMNVNDNQSLKSKLISELKTKYPEFLNFIDAEKASVDQLGRALQIVNQQYDHKIRLAALDKMQQRNTDNSLDLQNAYLDAQQKLADRLKIDVVALSKMSDDQRKALITQRANEELAKNNSGDIIDRMLAGAGTSEGARGIKIVDDSKLKQYLSLDQDYSKKKQALDDERLKVMGQISAENERQMNQDKQALENAQKQVTALEQQKSARIATYEVLFKDKGLAQAAYAEEIKQAKLLVSGIQSAMNPVAPEDKKTVADTPKQTKEEKKAIKDHEKAVKDVEDLQEKLKKLQDDVKASQVDADAGFKDKSASEIQAVVDKYNKFIAQVEDRLAKVAGLTQVEKAALSQMLTQLAQTEQQELAVTQGKQFKSRAENEYKDSLKSSQDYFNQQRQLAGENYKDGLTTYQQYQDKLRSLDVDEANNRATIAADYSGNVKAAAEALEKAKTDALQKGIQDRRTMEERDSQAKKDQLEINLLTAKKGSEAQWQAERAIIINKYEEQKKLQAGNATAVNLIDVQEKDELKAVDAKYWQQKLANIANVLGAMGGVFSNFMSYLNQGDQQQLDKETAANDTKKKSYQKMLDNKQISQEQYQKMVDDADAESEKKEVEIKKRMAKREKAAALFNAVIQTAQAVLQALASAPPPYSFILAAAAGVAGAIQIATIAAQKEPQYKTGGIFNRKGGIAKGASHSDGGISMINADGRKVGEMEGNEAYMILSKKTTAANGDIINKLLASSMSGSGERIAPDWVYDRPKQIDYGNAIETINYTRHYRNGGVTQPAVTVERVPATPGTTSSDEQRMDKLTAAIEKFNQNVENGIKADVSWSDLKKKNDQYKAITGTSAFS